RMRLLVLVGLGSLLAVSATADVWDFAVPSDDTVATGHEIAHGTAEVHDLARRPGLLPDQDWYRLRQEPYASYEVVVDGGSGAAGPVLERLDATGLITLQSSQAIGVGPGRSLR